MQGALAEAAGFAGPGGRDAGRSGRTRARSRARMAPMNALARLFPVPAVRAWQWGAAAFLGVIGGPARALACSGPGAESAIQLSGLIALVSLGLTVLCFLAGLFVPAVRRLLGWRGVATLLVACVFHPAIWLSTLRGDCGFTLRIGALLFMPVLAGLVALLVRMERRRTQRAAHPGVRAPG